MDPERFSRVLADDPSSVRVARAELRRFLGDSVRADDAELVVSELATNAVRHSRSRRDGGTYELRLQGAAGRLRIEVVDQGASGPAAVRQRPADAAGFDERGRGLMIVEALADEWGQEGDGARVSWWAELWTEKP